MAVNVYLCVVIAIIVLLIVAMNVYILVYFQNEEDKNTAIFPKVVVVFTFTIIFIAILLMPLEVANRNLPPYGGIPTNILNQVIYIIMVCLAFIVPFAFFYYEAEDPSVKGNGKQIKAAVKWDLCWAICFFIPVFALWFWIGFVEVPLYKVYSGLIPWSLDDSTGPTDSTMTGTMRHVFITYRISFALFLISMICLVGTFFLVFFGGIGIAALPLDLINAYRKRAKRMKVEDYAAKKLIIGQRSGMLLAKGKELQKKIQRSGGSRPNNRRDQREYNKFRAGVFMMEQEFKRLERAYGKGRGPVILQIIWEYVQLVLGFVTIIISISWLIHVILFMAPVRQPIHNFLNAFFIELDSVFNLFGTIAYAIFSFYLLWCVIKGCFKFGVRVPMLFSIHPMKVGETLMNAFLFNAFVLLLSTLGIVKFCATAFSAYNKYTYIDIIFNVGVNNLKYIKYFWLYYYWAMIALAILTAIYLFVNPSDKKAMRKQLEEEEDLPM